MIVYSKLFIAPELYQFKFGEFLNTVINCYSKRRRHLFTITLTFLLYILIRKVKKAVSDPSSKSKLTGLSTYGNTNQSTPSAKEERVGLNRFFFRNLRYLLKIVIPGWRTKEISLILIHSLFLLLRTLLSIYVASLDGKIVSSLVQGQGRPFLMSLIWWMIVAIPATFTNSMVK